MSSDVDTEHLATHTPDTRSKALSKTSSPLRLSGKDRNGINHYRRSPTDFETDGDSMIIGTYIPQVKVNHLLKLVELMLL
jgi:hypothetical protein